MGDVRRTERPRHVEWAPTIRSAGCFALRSYASHYEDVTDVTSDSVGYYLIYNIFNA